MQALPRRHIQSNRRRAVSDDLEALKACPLCGSGEVDPEGWASHNPETGVNRTGPACDDCGASADSIEQWNRRVPDPALPAALAEVKRLRAALQPFAIEAESWSPEMNAGHVIPDDYRVDVVDHITAGDMHRARAALTQQSQAGRGE